MSPGALLMPGDSSSTRLSGVPDDVQTEVDVAQQHQRVRAADGRGVTVADCLITDREHPPIMGATLGDEPAHLEDPLLVEPSDPESRVVVGEVREVLVPRV